MRLLEDHLSPQELASLPVSPEALASGGPDQQQLSQHLQRCEACSSLAQTHWSLSSLRVPNASATDNETCPTENVWLEFAAGLRPEQSSTLLAHAAGCNACAVAFREAMELMRTDQLEQAVLTDQLIKGLASATPAWQRRIAAQMRSASGATKSAESTPALPRPTFVQNLRRQSVWITFPTAAVILCAALFTGFTLWRAAHPSDARLFALAYNKQRTMVLRIPGGNPVPLASGTRGPAIGLNDPTELIKLRLRAQQHLDQTPNSPYWHQVLGKIQLLEQDGLGARRNFEIAQTTDENLPDLQSDLAAAWFVIGDKNGNVEAFAEAAELYSKQIHDHPTDSLLYYNRALCWERQNLNENALGDLRTALSLEHSPAWRNAIEAEIARLSTRSTTAPTDGYETALDEATRNLLPQWSNSSEARARIALTAVLGLHHHDRWLQDWIEARHTAASTEADQHLAAAVTASSTGEAELSLIEARRATELYQKANHHPGLVRAQLVETYSLQRLGHADVCLQQAARLTSAPRVADYAWLQTRALEVQAIVLNSAATSPRSNEVLSTQSLSVRARIYLFCICALLGEQTEMAKSKGLHLITWQ